MVCTVYDVYIQRFVYNTCMVWYGTVQYGMVCIYVCLCVCVSVRTWVCNGMEWNGMAWYVCMSSIHFCTFTSHAFGFAPQKCLMTIPTFRSQS